MGSVLVLIIGNQSEARLNVAHVLIDIPHHRFFFLSFEVLLNKSSKFMTNHVTTTL